MYGLDLLTEVECRSLRWLLVRLRYLPPDAFFCVAVKEMKPKKKVATGAELKRLWARSGFGT